MLRLVTSKVLIIASLTFIPTFFLTGMETMAQSHSSMTSEQMQQKHQEIMKKMQEVEGMMQKMNQSMEQMTPEHTQQHHQEMTEEIEKIMTNLKQIEQMMNHSSESQGTHQQHHQPQ